MMLYVNLSSLQRESDGHQMGTHWSGKNLFMSITTLVELEFYIIEEVISENPLSRLTELQQYRLDNDICSICSKFAFEYKEQLFHIKLKSRKTKKLSLLCNDKFPIHILN